MQSSWHFTRGGTQALAHASSPAHWATHFAHGGLHFTSHDAHACWQPSMHAQSPSGATHMRSSGPAPHISASSEVGAESAPASAASAAGASAERAAVAVLVVGELASAALTLDALDALAVVAGAIGLAGGERRSRKPKRATRAQRPRQQRRHPKSWRMVAHRGRSGANKSRAQPREAQGAEARPKFTRCS